MNLKPTDIIIDTGDNYGHHVKITSITINSVLSTSIDGHYNEWNIEV